MNHPLFYTVEEAEAVLKQFGPRSPTAEAIRMQAQTCPANLGFKVTVIGTRVYIPRKAFLEYWGIDEQKGGDNLD